MAFPGKFLRALKKRTLPLLPPSHAIDALTAQLAYIVNHRQLPFGPPDRSYSRYLMHLRASHALEDPLRQFITDKEYVKLYVKAKIGDEYNVPTFVVAKSAAEAATFQCTEDTIAKPTHMSGQLTLLKTGETLSSVLARDWISKSYYRISREANYRYLRPKIIFERFLSENGEFAKNYLFFCFHGVPKFVRVIDKLRNRLVYSSYDCDWNPLEFTLLTRPRGPNVAEPLRLKEMCRVAQRLSEPFESLRVDLYFCSGQIYVGELTNCPGAGSLRFSPVEVDEWVGAFIRKPGISADKVFAMLG